MAKPAKNGQKSSKNEIPKICQTWGQFNPNTWPVTWWNFSTQAPVTKKFWTWDLAHILQNNTPHSEIGLILSSDEFNLIIIRTKFIGISDEFTTFPHHWQKSPPPESTCFIHFIMENLWRWSGMHTWWVDIQFLPFSSHHHALFYHQWSTPLFGRNVMG